MLTLKLSLRDEQNFSNKNVQINKSSNKVDNKSVFHNCSPQGPCFKKISNDLKDNIINIFVELKNASTLKVALSNRAIEILLTTTVNQLSILTLIPNLTG